MRKRIVMVAVLACTMLWSACSAGNKNVAETVSKVEEVNSTTTPKVEEVNSPTKKPITLTLFDKNVGDPFTNPVALEITERTGVSIEVQQPTGNPDEKLNLMLVSGDLPDIALIDRREATLNKYIAGGALIPLNDLIKEHAPNIMKRYGDVLSKSVYEDGKNYYLNNWYGLDPDPNWAINMRMDVLEEFGYAERALAGDSFTQDEFLDLLKKFKEKYPEVDGKPSIPMTVNADHMPTIIGSFKAMYGMKTYYEHDGRLEFDVRDPHYLEMIKYINKLYSEGLLDREWGINKVQNYEQKTASGRVFATAGGIVGAANVAFRTQYGADTNKIFYGFKVTAPGVDPDKTTYGPRSSLGWDGVGITTANKHPVETIKFLDFLASEEGQYLLMWGKEGMNWNMENGVHKPTQEALDAISADWAKFSKETGARKWTWMIRNGLGEDGTPYDLMFRYKREKWDQHALKSMAGSTWDTALYDDLGPKGGTPDALSEQKIKDIIDNSFSTMVYAKSQDEIDGMYAKMIAELDANKAVKIEDIYTANYKDRMKLYNASENN
ncbi:extracellular solute-binding protein [Paenibacillus psychroresistens]|uniref:Extracellular solute-binding protein n=1 Tax=Paenibacillus psychroresistens TaxID=1778678 RepID=A0A6B8REA6_9BACL|nr:extracellular solute-binding protein [Paenibacillus psychroresistens]QGQ93833.1 extracellular solute-binding protein [Paenibacillus psychroresistens]